MSGGVEVLLGLLILAYLGSVLVAGRTIRGFGLPSGAEYLVLGVVLGPHLLGVVQRSTVKDFEPLLGAAAAWLAFVAGLGFSIVGERRVRLRGAVLGVVSASFVAGLVGGALFFALGALDALSPAERLPAALGAGAVSCESTRQAVRWIVERHGARGPVSDAMADIARTSALVPVLVLGAMFAMASDAPLERLAAPARLCVGAALGLSLGVMAAVLLGREFRRDESWGLLLGTTLLAAGVTTRLGLSAMTTLFVMGLTLSFVSRHRFEIKLMVEPTEKPVMLPVVLFVGAYVDFDAVAWLPALVAVALAARVAAELVRGVAFTKLVQGAKGAGPLIGLGLASTGSISLAVAFSAFIRLPGAASSLVLAIAAASLVFGEMVAPALLRRALERAGETRAVAPVEPSPLSSPRAAPPRAEGTGPAP